MENNTFLSFHNILLRQSDITLLDDGRWLNDALIGFVFEYFERVQFAHCTWHVAYIAPEVSQCIKLIPDEEAQIFIEPLQLKTKQLIMLAVNDHDTGSTTGGSHWSLLVFNKNDSIFRHFDSCANSNKRAAETIARKLAHLLNVSAEVEHKTKETLQQTNGYDCGIHVICNAEYLTEHFADKDCISRLQATTRVTVPARRQKLKQLLYKLANETS